MQHCMYQVRANALIGRRHERLPLQQTIHLVWCSMRAYYEQHCGLYAVPSPEYKQYPRSAQLERLKYSQLIMHESSRMLLCRFVKDRRRCVFWTFCLSNINRSVTVSEYYISVRPTKSMLVGHFHISECVVASATYGLRGCMPRPPLPSAACRSLVVGMRAQ